MKSTVSKDGGHSCKSSSDHDSLQPLSLPGPQDRVGLLIGNVLGTGWVWGTQERTHILFSQAARAEAAIGEIYLTSVIVDFFMVEAGDDDAEVGVRKLNPGQFPPNSVAARKGTPIRKAN